MFSKILSLLPLGLLSIPQLALAAPLPPMTGGSTGTCDVTETNNRCWFGTEKCCPYISAPLYATTSSDRIAFYDEGTDEYKRFAEDPNYLEMTQQNNQLDFSEVREQMLRILLHAMKIILHAMKILMCMAHTY